MATPRHYRYDPRPADKHPIDREAWLAQALAATAKMRGGRRGRRKAKRSDDEL